MKSISFMLVLCFLVEVSFTQVSEFQNNKSASPEIAEVNLPMLSELDSIRFSTIQPIKLPLNYKNLTTMPALVDNATQPYLRPVFAQVALECGQASGIGMGFTYEINYARNTAANTTATQYSTHFAWNFTNGGNNTGVSFFDTWEVLKGFGTTDVLTYGGTPSFGGATRWITGYSAYYNAMTNRISSVHSIPVKTVADLQVLKAWIFDHLGESTVGGVANFYASVPSVVSLAAGTPEAGKKVVTAWGGANHGMTIVGFNDSVRYDYNGDGLYTNNLDITNDGIVDLKDWEIGAFKFANTYNGGPAWADGGFAYMMYRTLPYTYGSGGIWNNTVYVMKTRPVTNPLLTLKATVKHNSRNKVKIYAGFSTDTLATSPDTILEYPVFNFQGGDKFMQGGTTESDKSLELGLDVSPFLNLITPGQTARYFLIFRETDATNTYTGQITSFSLIDYSGTSPVEIAYPQSNIPITENGYTRLGINRGVQFTPVNIVTDTLSPGVVYEDYSSQLTANGGESPYSWDFDRSFDESNVTQTFPLSGSTQISFSNNNSGITLQSLPFSFPFYGNNYSQIRISVDGYLMFEAMPSTYPYLVDNVLFFLKHESISPFYANLNINTASGHGAWFNSTADSVIIRWKTELYGVSSTELNFAVTLFPDGRIRFHYGNMNYPISTYWFSGIFKGDEVNFQYSSISGKSSISNGKKLNFTPHAIPPDLQVSGSGIVSGNPQNEYYPTPLLFKVKDASGLVKSKPVIFYTSGINNVVINGYSIQTPDDTIPAAGELVHLFPKLKNMALMPSSTGQMKISTSDPYVTINDSIITFNSIMPGITMSLASGFEFLVSADLPNGHIVHFNSTIISLADTFYSHIYLTVFAPILNISGFTANDGFEVGIDPGDTAHIQIIINNTGGAAAHNYYGLLNCADPFAQLILDSVAIGQLLANQADTLYFTAFISPLAQNSYLVTFNSQIFNPLNSILSQLEFQINIGLVFDDFETGNFLTHPWEFSGPTHWDVISTNPWQGTYCSRSGVITQNENCSMYLTKNIISGGDITFYYKVSSENDPSGTNYDYLAFYVDNVEKARWDGELGWAQASFYISAGLHTFKWAYVKDYSVNTGSDCAWVDEIVFPPCGQTITGLPDFNNQTEDLSIFPNPFEHNLTINIPGNWGAESVEIFDIQGRKLKEWHFDFANQPSTLLWNANDLSGNQIASGLFVVKLTGNVNSASIKVLKIN